MISRILAALRSCTAPAILIAAGVALNAPRAAAQDNLLDVRAVEFNDHWRATYQNFIYARTLASQRVMVQALYLRIPGATSYNEFSVGAGYRLLTVPGLSVYGLANIASATDATYAEPALLAQSAVGRFGASAYVQRYTPLSSKGVAQWLIDPVEAQYVVYGKLALGGSAYLYRANGGAWLRKVGPKISVGDAFGASELRVSRVTSSSNEFQLRRLIVF